MLLSAKYIIRNPEMSKDHLAIQISTLEGLLDVYGRVVATKGDSAKNPSMEALVVKRANGLIKDHVETIITEVGDD